MMEMTFEQAMRPGMLQAFANRRGSGYMMRSEKRGGSYGTGGPNRRPPKRKRAGFLYIFFTLLISLILWPVGMVMLWRRKVRLQAGTKLLISLLTLCLSVFLIVFALMVPVDNPEYTAFQDRANDWLDKAAVSVGAAGDAAYKKGAETWQVMSDFADAGREYTLVKAADAVDTGVEWAGAARNAIVGLFHSEPAEPEVIETPTPLPEDTEAPADTEAPTEAPAEEPTEAPADAEPTEEAASAPENAIPELEIHLPEQTPDEADAQALNEGALHADGTFEEGAVAAPAEITEEPAEEPTEVPAEEPTEAPAEEPIEVPAEPGEAEEVASPEPTEAPAEEPTEEPQEPSPSGEGAEPGEAEEVASPEPAETPVETPTEAPAEPEADSVEAAESVVEPAEAPNQILPVAEPTEAPAAAFTVKSAGEATVYYYTDGSVGFHRTGTRHNMGGAPAHTLAEAFADGKHACESCGMPGSAILSEPNVAWVDENHVIHTTDECPSFKGDWTLIPLAEAVEAGDTACPDCGATEYVNSVFPAPTPTPEPETVEPATALKPAAEFTVYYYDSSKGYHVAADCVGMSGAPAHTLAEAVAMGKHACGNCNPPAAELLGLPVLWLDDNNLCHTSNTCAAFSGSVRLITRDDALAQGLAPCTGCGAADYLVPGTVLAGN